MALLSRVQATNLAGWPGLVPSSCSNTEPVPATDENMDSQEQKEVCAIRHTEHGNGLFDWSQCPAALAVAACCQMDDHP